MKRIYFITIILFFCAMTCEAQITPQQFYDTLNVIRKKHWKKPLSRSVALELKAEKWLVTMHEKYDGLRHDWSCREMEVLTTCGEYLSCWMDSKPHRKALLSGDVTEIGIAYKNGAWCARLY